MSIDGSSFYENYSAELLQGLASVNTDEIDRAVDLIDEARRRGNLVLLAGNGGSAATANHFAADLSKNVAPPGTAGIRTVSLSSNSEAITAYGNDVDFESVFTRQAENLSASSNDVAIVISASGTSPNIVSLVRAMCGSGRPVIALTGFDGGTAGAEASVHIHVPLQTYEQVEDAHSIVLHMIVTRLKGRAAG